MTYSSQKSAQMTARDFSLDENGELCVNDAQLTAVLDARQQEGRKDSVYAQTVTWVIKEQENSSIEGVRNGALPLPEFDEFS